MAFLLLVLQINNPIPVFILPMIDGRACAINGVAMAQILKDDPDAACFDIASQTYHVFPRPTEHGEHIE